MQRSVHQLLKQAEWWSGDCNGNHMILVYCAGLFDYLSQKVCKKLVELFAKLLRPQGLVCYQCCIDESVYWVDGICRGVESCLSQ